MNDSSDDGQLHAMAKAAKDVLEAETLQALADEGYYSSTELKACEDDDIKAYVPVPEGNGRLEKAGCFSLKNFSHDPAADAYRCPAGELVQSDGRALGESQWPGRDPLCKPQSDLRRMPATGALSLPEGSLPDHRSLGTRRRSRTPSRADERRARTDAPPSALSSIPSARSNAVPAIDISWSAASTRCVGEWSLMALATTLPACSISSASSASLPAWQQPLQCGHTLSQLLLTAFYPF